MNIAEINSNIAKAQRAARNDYEMAIQALQAGEHLRIRQGQYGPIIIEEATTDDEHALLAERLSTLSGYERVASVSMWPIPPVNLKKHRSMITRSSVKSGFEYFLRKRDPSAHIDLSDTELQLLLKTDPRRQRASTLFGKTVDASVAKALAFFEPEIAAWINHNKTAKFEIPPQHLPLRGFDLGIPIGRLLKRGQDIPRLVTKLRITLVRDIDNHKRYWIKKILASD